ncbi:MAG: GatB/YqeY domain-containing protein, partial [Actinomycetes bacterium]
MSELKERLQSDLTGAIRSRNELTAATIRMALTAITNAEVAGTEARELTNDDVVAVLGKEAKKRREAAEAYDAAGRPELAERERAELGVLETYLPAQLSDEE